MHQGSTVKHQASGFTGTILANGKWPQQIQTDPSKPSFRIVYVMSDEGEIRTFREDALDTLF